MNKADCICELKWLRGVYAGMRKEYGSCVEALDMAINALEQTAWIPCSERLPGKNGSYLVTGRQGAVNKRRFEDGRWYGGWAVIAWMPLPTPWGGDEE